MNKIVAREKEKCKLNELLEAKEPQFLAIYGRRRVGKTFLIREFLRKRGVYFEVTGVKDASIEVQLKHFTMILGETFDVDESSSAPTNWQDALTNLRQAVEKIPQSQRVILFFDELPWLATRRSGLLQALDHLWNRYLAQMPNVLLVVCGSAASWMLKKIVHNRAGLYGRLTSQICLVPYTLGEVEQYLLSRQIVLERKQVIDLYLAFGGIPKYLSYVPRGKSPAQVIQETCFTPHAPLSLEFNHLFASLFQNYQQHSRIVETLAKKRSGLTQKELADETGFPSGGNLTRILGELEASGFILFIPEFGHKRREGRYRLIDEYSLFYLQWIKPLNRKLLGKAIGSYWEGIQGTPAFFSWSGYAFEGICFKHIDKILKALELTVVAQGMSSWNYRGPDGGAQIDLVIKRSDRAYNLCEIKLTNSPFQMTKEYAEKLRLKKELFRQHTKTNASLFTTLITTYGAIENSHYYSAVDSQLTMDALFTG